MILFCGEEYLLDINFELKSHKTADFMKNKGKKREKKCFCKFQISKKTVPMIYNIKFFKLILKSRLYDS